MEAREARQTEVFKQTSFQGKSVPAWVRLAAVARPSGANASFSRISARQPCVLPLPAGPSHKRTCTPNSADSFPNAQSNSGNHTCNSSPREGL